MPHFVYFIREDREGSPVKIGSSRHPEARLSQLQAASPTALIIAAVCVGPRDLEGRLHSHFATLRLKGEWFSSSPDLEAIIERASVGQLDPEIFARATPRPRAPRNTAPPTYHVPEPQPGENVELAGRVMLADMLRRAGLAQSQISRLVNGKITPKLDLAHRIEDMTGIPTEFWHNRNRGAAMWARVQEKKT